MLLLHLAGLRVFSRVLPLTQQPVNHSLCYSLTCDTQKTHFYREFRVPPVFFPCEALTWAAGMAVPNIHAWWCCWWAAVSPWALLCAWAGVWMLRVSAEPQPQPGCCSHSIAASPSPEITITAATGFFLCAAGHPWVVWVCFLQLDPSPWPRCVCWGESCTCPRHRAQTLLSPLWSPATVLGLTWPFRKSAEMLNKQNNF